MSLCKMCPSCGTRNNPNFAQCRKCRADLGAVSVSQGTPGFYKILIFLVGFGFISNLANLLPRRPVDRAALQQKSDWYDTLITKGQNSGKDGKIMIWNEMRPEAQKIILRTNMFMKKTIRDLDDPKWVSSQKRMPLFWVILAVGEGVFFLGLLRRLNWVRVYCVGWLVIRYFLVFYLFRQPLRGISETVSALLPSSAGIFGAIITAADVLFAIFTIYYLNSAKMRALYRVK